MFGKLKQILFSLTLLSLVVLCPGAQCLGPTPPDGDPPPGSPGPGDNPSDPSITGFDIAVEEGAFWQYLWNTEQTSFGTGGTSKSKSNGTFVIVLGTPKMIQGITFHELLLEGDSGKFTPPWRFLAFHDHRILGSFDGISTVTIFDGLRGFWPASGLFINFPRNSLITTSSETIDIDYILMPAIAVKTSSSEGGCEYYPGVGTICPSETTESSERIEYYAPGIGPVGFYNYGAVSSRFGGATTKTQCGIVGYSLTAIENRDSLEIEPNDSPIQAQTLQLGTSVLATSRLTDTGSTAPLSDDLIALSASLNAPDFVNAVYSDWYTFTVNSQQTVTIRLEMSPDFFDLDIVLFDQSLDHILGSSTQNNLETGEFENISAQVDPGIYYIGVLTFSANGRAVYSLSIQ